MAQMTKIRKWLDDNGIAYEYDGHITIYLERDCIWVNGFGEDMRYNKLIAVYQNTYSKYIVREITGYSMSHQIIYTSKQDSVIDALNTRLKGGK